MSPLQLLVLGPPEVRREDRTIKLPTRKALALLAYLAVERGSQAREHLTALLWPDYDPSRGRAALRNSLSYLREAVGGDQPAGSGPASADNRWSADLSRLAADRDTVRLGLRQDDDFDVDTLRRAERVIRGDVSLPPGELVALLEAATARYRGAFLEGFSLNDAPAFAEWAELQREDLRRRIGQVFERLSGLHLAAGDLARTLDVATRWVACDPVNEVAYRRVMQAYLATGDRVAALQAYATCRRTLAADLDVEPAPETEALAARARLIGAAVDHPIRYARGSGSSRAEPFQPQLLEAPLVGRADQFSALVEAFHRARLGQIAVVTLEGEAGIGKTRLAIEFLNWARGQGADVLSGRAFETGGHLPYQSLVDAFGHRLDQENAPDDLLGNVWLAELSRLLPDLRERYPDLSISSAGDGADQARLFEAVARLSEALAQRATLVLFVDDLQWADRASLDLLRFVARRCAERRLPSILVLALRTESLATSADLVDWLSALGRDLQLTRVALRPLSPDDLLQFVTRIGVRGDVTAFAEWLYSETRGQPFFALESLRALVERGVLMPSERRDGRREFSFAPLAVLPTELAGFLPPSVRQMISGRLTRLSPPAAELLVASAVLGQRSTFSELCQVARLTEDEALRALDETLGRQLLCETQIRTAPSVYLHSHDKIRDVVNTDAGDARRRVFHRRAVAALQGAGVPAAELAHHAFAAGLDAEAFQFSVTAGEASLRVFALRDAIDHFQRAREVLDDHPTALARLREDSVKLAELISRLYLHLGRAYELVSNRDQALAAYETLLSHARASGQAAIVCTVLNRLATLTAQNGVGFSRATALLEEARAIAEASGDRLGLAETEWSLAQMGVYTSNPPVALRHGERALGLARSLGASELIARSLNALAYAYRNLGRWHESAACAEEAASRYADLGNYALEVDSLGLLANSRVKCGDLWEGIRAGRQALARSLEIENPWGQISSAYQLTPGLLDAGLYADALTVARRGTATARAQATRPMLIFSLLELGAVHRALLALDEAREIHCEAWKLSQGLPVLFQEMSAAALCADEALAGRWDQAHTAARQALDARGSTLHQTGLTRWLECEALVRGGDSEAAERDVQLLGEHVGANRRFRIPFLRCLAVLALARGDTADAITQLVDAATLAREIGLPGETWSIEVALAEAYRAQDDDARATDALTRASSSIHALANTLEAPARTSYLAGALRLISQDHRRGH